MSALDGHDKDDIIITLNTNNRKAVYRTANVLKKRGYLGKVNCKITPYQNEMVVCISNHDLEVEEVETAMAFLRRKGWFDRYQSGHARLPEGKGCPTRLECGC